MTRRSLSDLTIRDLVQSFIEIAFEQQKAELHGDLRKCVCSTGRWMLLRTSSVRVLGIRGEPWCLCSGMETSR